jgi:hypothetical protein
MRLTAPVATVWRTEEEVLQDDGDKVPQDNLSSEQGLVERWDLARLLTIVVGQAEDQEKANTPKEDGNRVTDRTIINVSCEFRYIS